MKLRFFDFEVFPEWWCCTFGDQPNGEFDESIKNTFVIVRSDEENARDKLLQLFKEPGYVLAAYNAKRYDLIIAYAIQQGLVPRQVKIVNDIIINPGCTYDTKEHYRLSSLTHHKLNCNYTDLMDETNGSLKEKEAILGLSILESSVDFNKAKLTSEEINDIIYYNKHDVYALMVYYNQVAKEYINTKLMLGKLFNIEESICYKSTNAKLVGLVLNAVRTSFKDDELQFIELPEQIKEYCEQYVPKQILSNLLSSIEGFEILCFENLVSYANGGIHSEYYNKLLAEKPYKNKARDLGLYVESNSEYVLINDDCKSYYPSLLIIYNLLSRAVRNPQKFVEIRDWRFRLKDIPADQLTEEDKQTTGALKLVLNTTYGASGNKFLELYDPYNCSKTCRVGQILLTAFACRLKEKVPSLKIIQSNTDGLLLYVKRNELNIVKECEQEFETITGIELEQDICSKIWQKNVNNYMLVKENGKVKTKGAWLNTTAFAPPLVKMSPLTAYICAEAAKNYLLKSKDPMVTIIKCKDLKKFAITCKKGSSYRGVVQRYSNGFEEPLYKANRIYATTDTKYGKLYKLKKVKNSEEISYTQMPSTPEHCMLINNDLSTYKFEEIKPTLDYMYYVLRCADLLDIDWYQLEDGELYNTHQFEYNISD